MILVTLGTQRFPFNRLLSALDDLVEKGSIVEEVFAQVGHSTYKPKNYQYTKMISSNLMDEYVKRCSLIITHSGTSSIIGGLKEKKKVIVVPRQKEFGEHVDNHQIEIAQMFEKKGMIEAVYDVELLEEHILLSKTKEYNPYFDASESLLLDISQYIEEII
ncbi:hypothetical protein M3231_27435 [Neobacillus mesonae]|nr:hypothetical protein [Neobacillus mesonae]